MDEGSPKFSLNREDIKRILIGAAIALAGAFLTYLSEVVTQVDFGTWTPVVTAVAAIVINGLRKLLTDSR